MATPTYLLVHGAWHGAWCWRRLGDVLDQRSIRWATVDLPSGAGDDPAIDMTRDVAALREAATGLGPLVVVAHSYGGAVLAEAAPRLDELRGLVYVAALVPRPGQTASDVTGEYGLRSPLDETIRRDEGMLRLDPGPAALALYGDCDQATRDWAIGQVGTQTMASFRTPRTSENLSVISTYVICRRDQALLPEVQHEVAQRCDDVMTIDSDHSPFLSHPHNFGDLLESLHFHS